MSGTSSCGAGQRRRTRPDRLRVERGATATAGSPASIHGRAGGPAAARGRPPPAPSPCRSRTSSSSRRPITARVGQVIAFTNTGFEHHNATLDAGGCGTRTLADRRARRSRVRDGRDATRYHCTVHTWMTGTIADRRIAAADGQTRST